MSEKYFSRDNLELVMNGLKAEMTSNWNENNSNAYGYIENRPFYSNDPVEIVLFNNSIDHQDIYFIPSTYFCLTKDTEYKIIFNKTEYNCVAYDAGDNYICIGNQQIAIEQDDWWFPKNIVSDEPFFIFSCELNEDCGFMFVERGVHTISVSFEFTEIHKIDAKYLPKFAGEKVTGTKYVIDDNTLIADEGAEVFNDYKNNKASGAYSHAEGNRTTASGENSHAEGFYTKASGNDSHAEGNKTTALGTYSHAEGSQANASGVVSHAEGHLTKASGNYSHAEGNRTTASGIESHAEGYNTKAYGENSHTEGYGTQVLNPSHSSSTATATGLTEIGLAGHAEGYGTVSYGRCSHAEGNGTKAHGTDSHAEGYKTTAFGLSSHAEGYSTTASGESSHAEGNGTTASKNCSHAEGNDTEASGNSSHAEGQNTTASGNSSHAEGQNTTASGLSSHAEGYKTTASGGGYSHAEGNGTKASGNSSHAEGYKTTASGGNSHAEGVNTIAAGTNQHAQGKYNIADADDIYAHIVGNGTAEDVLSNAHTLDWDGNAWFSGDVYVGSTSGTNKDEGSKKLVTESEVDAKIATKQDKLTGNQGQVIGFDANGNAIAQDATDGGSTITIKTWTAADMI